MAVELTVQCFEAEARPRRAALALSPGSAFQVWLLGDAPAAALRGLRATILRRVGEDPPADAAFLMEVQLQRSADRGASLWIRGVTRHVPLDERREDGRGRPAADTEIASGTRFEVTLIDQRVVSFELQVAAAVAQGAAAAAAAGRARGPTAARTLSLSRFWALPGLLASLGANKRGVIRLMQRIPMRGTLGKIKGGAVAAVGVMAVLGIALLHQHKALDVAEERADAAEASVALAGSSADAAMASEAACLEVRSELARQLSDGAAERRAQAELALALTAAAGAAVNGGGPRMATRDARAWDEHHREPLVRWVQDEMSTTAPPEGAEPCLEQEPLLGRDLPIYALLWHPEPERLCTLEMAQVSGGVDRAGPWGLSARVAREFGGPSSDGAEMRLNPRWSAATLTTGLRAVQGAVLGADTGSQPPVAPGQLHLWGLTLFHALNHMPESPEGVLDADATVCVERAIEELGGRGGSAASGQPALPDLLDAAAGGVAPLTPTAGCPWPDDALSGGAGAALQAAAREALQPGGDEVP